MANYTNIQKVDEIMASYRLLHVTRDSSGDTDGLAEFTNSDTVLIACT